MGGLVVFLSLSLLAVCQAAVAPAVQCGRMPEVFKCVEYPPQLVTSEVSAECDKLKDVPECEQYRCLFTKSGWMDGDTINKANFTAFFDQYAKDHPQWQKAVNGVKTCIEADLKPQGIYLNCPTYDILQCAFTSFVRNTEPSMWLTTKECEYPRQFAASCPVCPPGCVEPEVPLPAGSCNACQDYPKST